MFSQSDPCFDILCKGIKTCFPPLLQAAITIISCRSDYTFTEKVIDVLEEMNKKKLFLLCKPSGGALHVVCSFMVQLAIDPS